ncbi:hypothetical protein Vretimale_4071 [Volvox reticuliferus]|nr:hypothetical protein Vretifemale_1635 [Volvox reticuliferus]GIL98698.1 hypothetical protein Vretimale_4071 [Volvox reticuliferus]
MFGLSVNTSAAYPALLAAADPAAILSSGSAATAAYAHQQLLGAHGSLAGIKLAGVSQLHGAQWTGSTGLTSDINGSAVLREHLQAHLGSGSAIPASLAHMTNGQQSMNGVDSRVLLNGYGDGHPALALSQASAQGRPGCGDGGHPSSAPGSPQHQQQQQASSPQQPNSQLSQQPSPPQAQQNGAASEEPDADALAEGTDVVVQGRRIRIKADIDTMGSAGFILGGGGGSSAFSGAQLAGLNLPPSMASLAAVMGPGGGPSSLGGNLHPLLCAQESGGTGGLLDGGQSSLSRHNLQLALQQHQIAQQQHESLQQLNGLLPHSSAPLHVHHPLLHGLGNQNGNPSAAVSSTAAAAVAALDPLQRTALLQQAAGLGGVGWLQGGSSMLPSSLLLQVPSHSSSMNAAGSSSAADWLSLAAAAAAACPKVHAPVATHGAVDCSSGGIVGAAQMFHAQAAAAFAAGGGCSNGWPGSGSFQAVPGAAPSWSLWSSYNGPASGHYAGYALQAAAAAYSGAR